MTLAWASVAALVVAVALSVLTKINVGILSLAMAWLVGVYLGGMSVNAVLSGFPVPLLVTLVGVTLLFSMADTNGTLSRADGAGGPALPRERGAVAPSCSSPWAWWCRPSVPAAPRPAPCWRRPPWPSRGAGGHIAAADGDS